MLTKEEILVDLVDLGSVTIELSDGSTCEVGTGDNWIGGTEDGYMCDLLGNVQYGSAEWCVDALLRYLTEIGLTAESIS